jgi:Fe2+ transport system protein FeoA
VDDNPLLKVPPGTAGKISRITTDDPDMLSYLGQLGIKRGVAVVFTGVAPFDGPASLKLADRDVHLARRVAEVLYLRGNGELPAGAKKRAANGG